MQTIKSSMFISYLDSILNVIELQPRKDEEKNNINRIEHVQQLLISSEHIIEPIDSNSEKAKPIYLLDYNADTSFENISENSTVNNDNSIAQSLSNENLILRVHSMDGYDFSAEFVKVYKGSFNKKRIFNDTLAVIKRALLAADPSMPNSLVSSYSSLILRISAREAQTSSSIALQAIMSHFPQLQIEINSKFESISQLMIFIGRSNRNGQIILSIRSTPSLFSPNNLSKGSPFPGLSLFSSQNKIDNKSFTKYRINFICYRDFSLSDKLLKIDVISNDLNSSSTSSSNGNIATRVYILKIITSNPIPTSSILNRHEELIGNNDDNSGVIPLESKNSSINDTSFCCSLMGWGYNSDASLGIHSTNNNNEVLTPRPIPLPLSIAVEKVHMIACSSRHTLLLTHFGSIYGCGENSEGALGLKDFINRSTFELIDWRVDFPKISKITVGSGSIGSHSMALCSDGSVYGWGVGSSTGVGVLKSISYPEKVDLSNVAYDISKSESIIPSESLETVNYSEVKEIACGSGFSVFIMKSGHVCSAGQWANGVLGLGPLPLVPSKRRKASQKQIRYQLRPRLIDSVKDAVSVSCGESHSLLLLSNGNLLTWGKNSCGQLGVGPSWDGRLSDCVSPVLVAPFCANNKIHKFKSEGCLSYSLLNPNYESSFGKMICAGAFHSLIVDTVDNVWSWGARGSPCLGHNDSGMVNGEWSKRINTIFSIESADDEIQVPFELLSWCKLWSIPRKIESLSGMKIQQLSAGDLHSSFLTENRQFYLCGSGPAVPYFMPSNRDWDENNNDENNSNNNDNNNEQLATLVASPRQPSASWLSDLCTRQVFKISSGGSRVFILVDEESISYSLTEPLLRKLNLSSSSIRDGVTGEDQSMSLSSQMLADLNIFEAKGRADCMILASGRVFLCHKALLAQRSPELRDMIIMETPTDLSSGHGSPQPVIQILLPELTREAARALIYFLYRDNLPDWVISDVNTLHSLSRTGKTLHMPRLQLLCEYFIKVLKPTTILEKGVFSYDNSELPPSTLARDLGALVGDSDLADIRFIAEGKPIFAHRFILENRCEYFAAMFRSGLHALPSASSNKYHQDAIVDVVVP
eukprot:gene6372-8776_t